MLLHAEAMTSDALDVALDLFAPESLADPYPLLSRLRNTAPVHRVPGTRIHLVARYDDVVDAVMRPDDFSSHLRQVLAQEADGTLTERSMDAGGTIEQVLATADDPAHRDHRTLLMTSLSKRVRALTGYVESRTAELWGPVARAARDEQPVDVVAMLADPLPASVVAELVGLPHEDLDQLLRWVLDSTELLGGIVDVGRMDAHVSSVTRLWSHLEERLAHAVDSPGDDLLGVLAEAHLRDGLATSTGVLILLQLLGAGAESTSALLGSALRMLAERPDLLARLRADPALVDPYVDEVLRLESPFRGHYRSVARPAWLGGVGLVPGDHLLLLWGSANRDERHLDHPDELDLDRPGVRQHLAFGKGMHFCAGSALARLEATTVLRTVVGACSEIALDGTDAAHWVPSIFVRRHDRLRLRLTIDDRG